MGYSAEDHLATMTMLPEMCVEWNVVGLVDFEKYFDSWAVVRCANFGRCASSELGSESTEEVCNTANERLRPSKLEVDPCVAGIRGYSPLVIVPSGGPGPFGGCG